MRVGIVRTRGSVCRCAESIAQGLASLGHDGIITDSEEIEFQVEDFVHQCDLIIDHTDTFKGRGFLRAWVRLLLEARGPGWWVRTPRLPFMRMIRSLQRHCFPLQGSYSTRNHCHLKRMGTPSVARTTSGTQACLRAYEPRARPCTK